MRNGFWIALPDIYVIDDANRGGWIAYFDGEEEEGNYGSGKKAEEAVEDFLCMYGTSELIRIGRLEKGK